MDPKSGQNVEGSVSQESFSGGDGIDNLAVKVETMFNNKVAVPAV